MNRYRHPAVRPRPTALILLGLVFVVLGGASITQAQSSTAAASPPAPISTSTASVQLRSHTVRSGSGLVYSSASAHQVQPQPAPGSCHATGPALYASPDPHCTPGALNPAVRQATIGRTICMSGYTKTIRPSESVTEREKLASMAAYSFAGRSPRDFEYDHLVSLELGGAVNDPRNLWPEPGGSPNPKDSVENQLHRLVCDGRMPLAQAQHIIATGWVSYAKAHGGAG